MKRESVEQKDNELKKISKSVRATFAKKAHGVQKATKVTVELAPGDHMTA